MKRKRTNNNLPVKRRIQWSPLKSNNWKRMRTEEFLKIFLTRIEPTLHPNTYKDYAQIIRDYLVPEIGAIKLKDLNPDHIQTAYSNSLKNGISPTRVRFIHKVLNCALNLGVKWAHLEINPAEFVTIPKKIRREMKIFTVEEVRIFLDAVKGSTLESLFHLAVTTGIRQSEILGLKWSDLDWETGNLRIQRQLQRVHRQGLIFSEPKSASGRRLIVLGQSTLQKLREHRTHQDLERNSFAEEFLELELIFCRSNGSPIGPRRLYRKFRKVIYDAGLPEIRFHDLRHTAATLMLQSGVNVKVIQNALGHSTISLTLDTYSHLQPIMQLEAAQMVDNLINN